MIKKPGEQIGQRIARGKTHGNADDAGRGQPSGGVNLPYHQDGIGGNAHNNHCQHQVKQRNGPFLDDLETVADFTQHLQAELGELQCGHHQLQHQQARQNTNQQPAQALGQR